MKRRFNISLVSVAVMVLLSILALNIGPVSADDGKPSVNDETGPIEYGAAPTPAPTPPEGALIVDDNGFANSFSPDTPSPGNLVGPYLWTGTDMAGDVHIYARTFFKFVVPPHPGEAFDVWLGALCNYTKGEDAGTTAAYYFADNGWNQATLTWNSTWNQSFGSNKGAILDSVNIPFVGQTPPLPNKYYEWKVTDGAENIWKNGGTITLVLCAANESPSIYWRDFQNKYWPEGVSPAYLRAAPRTIPLAPVANPLIGTGAPTSHNASLGAPIAPAPPVSLTNIQTQSASLSAKSVTPGTPVTVTASIINKSAVNGIKKVTLYVNGQVESTQGVTVNSGGSTKLTFNVSRSEPGDYNVYVDGVPAGSFKVEMVAGNDTILIFSAALIALAFIAGMVMLWRRQRAV